MPHVPVVTVWAQPIRKPPEIVGKAVLYGAPIFAVAAEKAVPEIVPDEMELVTWTRTNWLASLPVRTKVLSVAFVILLHDTASSELCHW